MKPKFLIWIFLILCCRSVFSQDRFPSMPFTDRIRLGEAFRLADEIGVCFYLYFVGLSFRNRQQ